jgi:catecholate siderophore receptor
MKRKSLLKVITDGRLSRRRGTARLFVLGGLISGGLFANPAHAQIGAVAVPAGAQAAPAIDANRQFNFNIAPGDMLSTAQQFEAITGLEVVLGRVDLQGLPSPGVRGTMTAPRALDALLMGTGVGYASTAPGVITLDVRASEFVTVAGSAPSLSSPKYTEPLRDTPQTVVVIPQQVYQEQGATSLRDALRNTPGITLTAGEGGAAPGDNLLIRGFSARNDVYIDGARDPGVTSRDMFNTEAVEVAKGPSSVTAGRGSTGGAVNLVTKSAETMNFASARLIGGNASYKRGTLDVNRRLSPTTAIRVNGMWQDAGVPRRDEVQQKGWGVAPTLGLGLGKPTSLTLSYQHLHQNNVPDYGLPGTLPDLANAAGITVKDLDFSNFYGLLARDHEKLDSDVATATIEHRFSRTLSLRNLTRYGQNQLDRVVTSPRAATVANSGTDPAFNPTIPQVRRTDTKYQYRTDKTITNQTDLSASFTTGAIGHNAVAGLEFARDRQPSHAATDTFANGRPPVTDLANPDPFQTYRPSITPTGASSEARSHSAALYAFDTVKLGAQWQLDLSGRYDRIDVQYDTISATGVPAAFGRTDSAFSGRTGVVFKPATNGSIYGAYSTSFNPSFDGSFGLTLAATGANNAALPPERSHNVELGTKWDLRPTLAVTGAVFRTEKTNAKTTDTSGATVLAGDQLVTGVELGLSGNLTSRWTIFSGLSVMDGRVRESANVAEIDRQLAYVPQSSFNLWSTFRLPLGITLGGGAQYTAGYYFSNTNALASSNAAAIKDLTEYWLYNMVGMYRVNEHVTLQINGTNLSNAKYVDRGYSGHFLPGPGRAIQVGPVINF